MFIQTWASPMVYSYHPSLVNGVWSGPLQDTNCGPVMAWKTVVRASPIGSSADRIGVGNGGGGGVGAGNPKRSGSRGNSMFEREGKSIFIFSITTDPSSACSLLLEDFL